MKILWPFLFLFLITVATSAQDQFFNKNVVLNISDTETKNFLELIARQSGLRLEADPDIAGNISYSFGKITAKRAMDIVAKDHALSYEVVGDVLSVRKNQQSTGETPSDIVGVVGGNKFNYLNLKYLNAKDVPPRISALLKPGEQVIVDEVTNSIGIFSSVKTISMIKAYVASVDKIPPQILIEAQIVEITKNKSRELGISFGNLDNPSAGLNGNTVAGIANSHFASVPNASLGIKLGHVASNVLQMRLDAAEQRGDARVISRPKVVTLNNVSATILSGITYHVKTNGAVVQGQPTAGEVTSINAGLSLEVTPTKVGDREIKLKISVSNSEPDEGSSVDGIPGIIENSANTTIIVNSGDTATMAGLIKSSLSKTKTGTPGLSEIPFFGWLFKSEIDRDKNSEMVIFITPRILDNGAALTTANLAR